VAVRQHTVVSKTGGKTKLVGGGVPDDAKSHWVAPQDSKIGNTLRGRGRDTQARGETTIKEKGKKGGGMGVGYVGVEHGEKRQATEKKKSFSSAGEKVRRKMGGPSNPRKRTKSPSQKVAESSDRKSRCATVNQGRGPG